MKRNDACSSPVSGGNCMIVYSIVLNMAPTISVCDTQDRGCFHRGLWLSFTVGVHDRQG